MELACDIHTLTVKVTNAWCSRVSLCSTNNSSGRPHTERLLSQFLDAGGERLANLFNGASAYNLVDLVALLLVLEDRLQMNLDLRLFNIGSIRVIVNIPS